MVRLFNVPVDIGDIEFGGGHGSPLLMQFGTTDPTSTSAQATRTDGSPLVLPAGSRMLGIQNANGGATGGGLPTINVGTSTDEDAFALNLSADSVTQVIASGALIGQRFLTDTAIYAGKGSSAATGGEVVFVVYYSWDTYDVKQAIAR